MRSLFAAAMLLMAAPQSAAPTVYGLTSALKLVPIPTVAGPQGPAGPTGPQGPQGVPGTPGGSIFQVVPLSQIPANVLYIPTADGTGGVIVSVNGTLAAAITLPGKQPPLYAYEGTKRGAVWYPMQSNPNTADGQPMVLKVPR